jgi:hemin uptake protein HemP
MASANSGQPREEVQTCSLPIVSSRDLLSGHREVIIQHGAEQYRLRLTSSNKLILTK